MEEFESNGHIERVYDLPEEPQAFDQVLLEERSIAPMHLLATHECTGECIMPNVAVAAVLGGEIGIELAELAMN